MLHMSTIVLSSWNPPSLSESSVTGLGSDSGPRLGGAESGSDSAFGSRSTSDLGSGVASADDEVSGLSREMKSKVYRENI